jgi:hypothetical protein
MVGAALTQVPHLGQPHCSIPLGQRSEFNEIQSQAL